MIINNDLIFKKSFSIIKNVKLNFFTLFTLILLGSFLELLTISLIGPLLVNIFSDQNSYIFLKFNFLKIIYESFEIGHIIVFLILAVFSKSLISIFIEKKILNTGVQLKDQLRTLYLDNIRYKISFEVFKSKDSSYYIQNIYNLITKFANEFLKICRFTAELLKVLFMLFFLIILDKWLLLIFIIIFFYLYLFDKYFKKKLSEIGKIENLNFKLSFKFINEFYKGIKDIIIFSRLGYFVDKILDTSKKANHFEIRRQLINVISSNIIEPLLVVLSVLIFYYNSITKDISTNDNLIYIFLIFYILVRFKPFISNLSNLINSLRYMKNTVDILYDDYSVNKSRNIMYFESIKKIQFDKITINDLSYRYSDENFVFQKFNLNINRGDIIGIFGRSGTGKSTFLNIISGFLDFDQSKINIFPKKKISTQRYLKSLIGYIPQNPFFFSGNIYENISLYQKINSKDKENIKNLITTLKLEYILKRGDNYDLKESGAGLSGGELQRIAICRALFFDKKIILIDEGFNSIDTENIKIINSIINKLSKLGITFIIVSHNKKHFKTTNKIINLDKFKN